MRKGERRRSRHRAQGQSTANGGRVRTGERWQNVRKWIYDKRGKTALAVLQGLAAGVLACCLLNIVFWTEGSFSLREMARNYEESDLFFRQIDKVLSEKIHGQQNETLFELDGEKNLSREIDIQSYGMPSGSVQDMNTTYRLEDLVNFAENGGRQRLHDAIEEALTHQGENGQEAGERLDGQSGELETILPVTGISLAECSRWYSDSADFVLKTYKLLDEVCAQIYERYTEYQTTQEESWSRDAPSNLRYCVQDTTSGILYTNTSAGTYEDAVEAIQRDGSFTSLYEGERSFNIMMANPDNLLNEDAADWFMDERFVSTNEKVYLAVNTDYPVRDVLRMNAEVFARRENIIGISLAGAAISILLLAGGLVLSVLGAGRSSPESEISLTRFDRTPIELSAGLLAILTVIYVVLFHQVTKHLATMSDRERLLCAGAAVCGYLTFLWGVLSLIRRFRAHTIWKDSVMFLLVLTWKKVTSARAASGQLLFFYIIFFILNFLLLLFGRVGIFMVFVLDMAVLLYLLRDMAGKQSIYDGIHRISEGDLEYKIDTAALQGETLEMAKAVNEMGDGLQKAVDAIIRNERLKAELITNVSHDIKTPLTSIVNYVDLLKRENLQGERVRHYIEVLEQKSQRLRQLTEDLVEASKISSGNIELQMIRMQLQSILLQAYGEFQDRFEERGITPVWEMEKEPVCIMADGRQMWRVLENLFGNVYKYAAEGTRIYIDLYREDDMVYLSLQNIAREKLTTDVQELAGRFVRGDKSRSTEGSGLGLSIAQSLVELQGGAFDLAADGDLFRVTMTFPAAEEM